MRSSGESWRSLGRRGSFSSVPPLAGRWTATATSTCWLSRGGHRRDTATLIFEKLRGVGAAVDVVVVTPEDVERYGNSHALVIKPALREGKVVYDAT